jgi:hypothetical protein
MFKGQGLFGKTVIAVFGDFYYHSWDCFPAEVSAGSETGAAGEDFIGAGGGVFLEDYGAHEAVFVDAGAELLNVAAVAVAIIVNAGDIDLADALA